MRIKGIFLHLVPSFLLLFLFFFFRISPVFVKSTSIEEKYQNERSYIREFIKIPLARNEYPLKDCFSFLSFFLSKEVLTY